MSNILSTDEVKNYLIDAWVLGGSGDTSLDQLIAIALDGLDGIVESVLWYSLTQKDIEEIQDGTWSSYVFLEKGRPVNSLTSFQYNNGTISLPIRYDFDVDGYALKKDSGMIALPYSKTPRGFNNIKIIYNAWYSTANIPHDIKIACFQWIAGFIAWAWNENVSSESVDGASVQFKWSAIPREVMSVFMSHKNINV